MRRSFVLLATLALAALAAACNDQASAPKTKQAAASPPASPPAAAGNSGAAAAEAKEMFTTRCAPCHGNDGKGDGPGAAALNPKPRNYTDAAWQKSVTDDSIKKTILMGGAAVGKSPIMPASPDLESKPEVVDGLVKIVRGFGPK